MPITSLRGLVAGLLIAVALLVPAPAIAGKRVALVIGNSAYKFTGELANPKHDATDMAAMFRRLGWQVVEGIDLDKAAFDKKIREFAGALNGADAGVFFYAGHGLQVAGQNYLVPIDAELTTPEALDFEMVRMDLVHRTMERAAQTNIIFLDACRNNPLERSLRRTMGTRSAEIGHGLAAIESGIGTLISFSTHPGSTAADGSGRNSPFTSALLKYMSSGEDLSAILISVRNDVMAATQRQQVPWEHSALTGRFYFGDGPAKGAPGQQSEAATAWAAVEKTKSIAALEAFAARYKDTFYADMAKARIEELKKEIAAPTNYWFSKPIPIWTGPKSPPDSKSTTKAWVKVCETVTKDTAGKAVAPANVCMTMHERLDGNTGVAQVSIALRQVEGRADQQFMVMVPLGMAQQPGMRVSILSKDQWESWYRGEKLDESTVKNVVIPANFCHAAGCPGEGPLTPDLLAALKSGNGLIVSALHNSGQVVAVPVTLAGFLEVYEGAPIDNKVYSEARKKLMEQIAARQAQIKAQQQAKENPGAQPQAK